MPIIIIALGVAILLVLMIKFKMNGFVSLIFVAAVVGVMEGMHPLTVIHSIEKGIGGTLGGLALILGFGAMLGKIISDSGAAQRIAMTLMKRLGKKRIQLAMLLTGIVVGLAMFFEVGFVLLLPLVYTIVLASDLSLMYVGIPMVVALSVTHCFLPPHPAPTAIAQIFSANLGVVLFYGTIILIPTVIVAGPIFTRFVRHMDKEPPQDLCNPHMFKDSEMPKFSESIFVATLPVILMAIGTITKFTLPDGNIVREVLTFIGNASVALFIAVILGIFKLGLKNGRDLSTVMKSLENSIASIAMIVFIIAGGGAFKQVLVDSGVSNYIAHLMHGSSISPLLMCWLVAAMLRVALGSATVASLTAAGIVLPLAAASHADPALMVLATGAGSVIASHVNDPGFWLFKGYFNLTVTETLKTWTVLETIISVMGLIGVLSLNAIVH
ncbi:gluconate:H+ symporter [Celerinatantimonas diazotrophica]|uniref:L-idonate permease n=1 Tax=Celerinatantimonas diazotrophica TaxID=412034 RepID=A0A4R1K4C5_9GAMM|nr:gluconate:H+ symporter [Celerinatantimonas diazotrophica]TCK58985.1 L-idonate permease [Celerinatantimonas diazotrophica]CAG9297620.1 Gnt-II system L-idonate transporter [Celerinatantimonas diazotrophica]